MSLLFRLAVYVPVLFMIAIVVVGQRHSTAAETISGAVSRTVRWLVWTAVLLGIMTAIDVLLIGW
ncbi:MAG: hypothetical protein AB8H80_12270 [Planctomycetota bacterium]